MKTLFTSVLIFITLMANAQSDLSSLITKNVIDKDYIEWYSPDYATANGAILFSFVKSVGTKFLSTRIKLRVGYYGPYTSSGASDVIIRFEDGDQLAFRNVSIDHSCQPGTSIWTNMASVELSSADLYRLKTKKVVSFVVAQRYYDDLPARFQTNTMAFAYCVENAN
jgi:hypothetical protein